MDWNCEVMPMRRNDVAYRHFTDEEIDRANRTDILYLAEKYGYESEKAGRKAVHMKHSGGLYLFPESNRFFQWTGPDSGIKGGAVDFVMREEKLSFGEAVGKLLGKDYALCTRDEIKPYKKSPRKPLVLPDRAKNFRRAYWYLTSVRGIDPEIVRYFMGQKMIYQEAKYGNCVFVGYDPNGTAKYCAMRAASEKSSFKMDAENSDKSYPFYYEGKSDLLIVSESPIDLMSHATLAKVYYNRDWTRDHRLSLGCLWDGALERYLKNHPEIKRLVFAVDNDYLSRDKDGILTNWGQRTAAKWYKKYGERGYECTIHRPHLKDFNLDLTEMRKGRTPEDLDLQRESELQVEFEKDAVEDPPDENEYDLEL